MNERFHLDERLLALREQAKQGRDPTAPDDTLAYLLTLVQERKPRRILEIGTAEGLTACAMLMNSDASLTGIELDPERAQRAREHFSTFGLESRVRLHEGDAGEILPMLEGEYDLIFLDGPKVQYRQYLPDCKRLLASKGVLLSDDVLLFGWVSGKVPTPPKRRMLVEHIRQYLEMLRSDSELQTSVLEIGEGLAVSIKK
jgi:predicted O-methyltransferase YrrM